jgi:site-specific recombinase XerD
VPNPLSIQSSTPASTVTSVPDLASLVRGYSLAARAKETLRAYRGDFNHFAAWARENQLTALPASPMTVAMYMADLASRGKHKSATIVRRLTSITKAHQAAGFADSPASSLHFVISETLKGIKRTLGTAQKGKDALLTADIRRVAAAAPPNLLGLRDRALIGIGFAGGFRRSELAGIEIRDLRFKSSFGVTINLRKSKRDQEQAGREVGIPYGKDPQFCVVTALQNWIKQAGIRTGPVMQAVNRHGQVSGRALSGSSIARILKKAASRAGYEPAPIAGHSLRAGHVTQAALNGVSEPDIMKTTGHKSRAVLRKYFRNPELFQQNSAAGLGL